MITIDRLTKRIAGERILHEISLTVPRAQTTALIGPSGTGKSVLLKHIVGLLLPDAGDVLIDGQSIVRARHGQLSLLRRRMGYVFQDAALLDSLTVEQNLRLALNDDAHGHQQIEAALDAVNLDTSVLGKLPGQLSGGMRKRVGVARALVNNPDIILYDEPTTGLDPQNIGVINDVIIKSRAWGATSLVVTHDLSSIPTYADRVLLLQAGQLQFDGTPDELFSSENPMVRSFMAIAA